jgi:DNA-binding response OmpR family regulator
VSGLEHKDILIVDDDDSIRNLLRTTLERAGMRCSVATDGLDASNQIEHLDYALVLLDLMMPRLDGVGFVKRLRESQRRGGGRPVVLMMTAAPERQDLGATGDMVQAVLSKPFDIHEIVGLCHDCVEVRRAYAT